MNSTSTTTTTMLPAELAEIASLPAVRKLRAEREAAQADRRRDLLARLAELDRQREAGAAANAKRLLAAATRADKVAMEYREALAAVGAAQAAEMHESLAHDRQTAAVRHELAGLGNAEALALAADARRAARVAQGAVRYDERGRMTTPSVQAAVMRLKEISAIADGLAFDPAAPAEIRRKVEELRAELQRIAVEPDLRGAAVYVPLRAV